MRATRAVVLVVAVVGVAVGASAQRRTVRRTVAAGAVAAPLAAKRVPTRAPRPAPVFNQSFPYRALYVQFDRPGYPNGYWSGNFIREFSTFDAVVGRTPAEEAAAQFDAMKDMGFNTITFELRAGDADIPGFSFPTCNINIATGLQWPTPTATETANLTAFFQLADEKGFKIWLRLVNTNMDRPFADSAGWYTAILNAVKNEPALNLVLFEGNTRTIDNNGDNVNESCGIPAEPPLYLGPTSPAYLFIKDAITHARGLGIPAHKLSAEAIVGAYIVDTEWFAGPNATDNHLWYTVKILKRMFDELAIPDQERTYALSMYEHRKCSGTTPDMNCVDADPHSWAVETMAKVRATIGRRSQARIVIPEGGVGTPVQTEWDTRQTYESLARVLRQPGVSGISFWLWTNFETAHDSDPSMAEPVKRRGPGLQYNPVQREALDFGALHIAGIPNPSFELDADANSIPDGWQLGAAGSFQRYHLAGEAGQPLVPTRGAYAARLTAPAGLDAPVEISSSAIPVRPGVTVSVVANLRFSGPTSGTLGSVRGRIEAQFRTADGQPSASPSEAVEVLASDPLLQGKFGTVAMQFGIPADCAQVVLKVVLHPSAPASQVTLDVDNLR